MGSGKSKIGNTLSKLLKYNFIEIDQKHIQTILSKIENQYQQIILEIPPYLEVYPGEKIRLICHFLFGLS